MNNTDLHFDLGSKIEIENKEYIVQGSILFSDKSSSSTWTEYKIRSCSNGETRWLSIDLDYNEYALYEQIPYKNSLGERTVSDKGYHEVDSGVAKVTGASGDVDVAYGDEVSFKEFEDSSEENIISIETWEDETEYSKGYYLEASDIKKIDSSNYNTSNYNYRGYSDYEYTDYSKRKIKIIAAVVAALFLIFLGANSLLKASNKTMISKFLASNSNFKYSTSVTSDLDINQKADVYSTPLSVETTTKMILDKIGKKAIEVQENTEDGSVGILTNYEYCFVYLGEDNGTLVQISSRLYAYSSNNTLYHGHSTSSHYYRKYYYTTAYSRDNTTYNNRTNAYSDYSDGYVNIDPNDKYKSYSNTIRQSSVSRRSFFWWRRKLWKIKCNR